MCIGGFKDAVVNHKEAIMEFLSGDNMVLC